MCEWKGEWEAKHFGLRCRKSAGKHKIIHLLFECKQPNQKYDTWTGQAENKAKDYTFYFLKIIHIINLLYTHPQHCISATKWFYTSLRIFGWYTRFCKLKCTVLALAFRLNIQTGALCTRIKKPKRRCLNYWVSSRCSVGRSACGTEKENKASKYQPI